MKAVSITLKKNISATPEGFIFNPNTGDSFSTNTKGSEIIALLKKKKLPSEIVQIVCSKYDIDQNRFEKDLYDFTCQLKDYAIIW
jgi:hypothetical protein